MDDLIERVQSAIDRPEKPNIIGMHVDDAQALLARIKATERQIAAAYAYSASVTGETALLGQVSADAEAHMDEALKKAYEEGRAEMRNDLRERVARAIQAAEIPEGGWPEDRPGVWVMALDEAVKAADAAFSEASKPNVRTCQKCGKPENNHRRT